MNRFLRYLFLSVLFIYIAYCEAFASPYFDVGTSIGTVSNGDTFFQQTTVSGSSFVGSFNFYIPVTSQNNFAHIDLGLQNRLTSFTTASSQALAMASTSLAIRIEFWRFYAGAGYAPLTFTSKPGAGIMGLQTNSGATAYFGEAGVLWRVVPEFQIALTYALEYGVPKSGSGLLTSSEMGLRFRFPMSPKEGGGKSEVKFDGFRYPFGFMK